MTMGQEVFEKQPTETYTIGVDFEDKLPAGASVTAGTVGAFDPAGADVSGTVLSSTNATISGTQARIKVLAGTHGIDYRLKFQITLSNSDVREKDILMQVRNV